MLIGTSFVSIILIGTNTDGNVITKSSIGDTMVTLTPKVTNLLMSPKPLVTKTPDNNVTILSPPILTQSPIPLLTPKLSTTKTSGKVVINEIAWAGTSASATDEWIELYNIESRPIDISSWQLVSGDDSPDIIFSEGTIIQANSYFLIERTDDNTIRDITADLIVSFGQGGLNNAGEMVRLFDSSGAVLDVVGDVSQAWYFGDSSSKSSMERIDPMKAGNDVSNWKSFSGVPVSHDTNGNLINGTPKAKNSILATVVVITSGGVGSPFSPSSGSSVTPSPLTTPSPTPTPSESLTPTPSAPESPTPLLTPTPSTSKIVINEIAWMGTATSSNDEWLELYNPTNAPVDLTGWTLKSKDGTPNISLSGTIVSFGFYLLERTNDSVISDLIADKIYSGALGNGGESLELRDSSGNLEDSADFASGWPAGDNTTKSSMERIDSVNWATNDGVHRNGLNAGGGLINGTPRAINGVGQ